MSKYMNHELQQEIATGIYDAIEKAETPLERNAIRDTAVMLADKLVRHFPKHFDRIEFLNTIGLDQYGELTNEEYDKWAKRMEDTVRW